MTSSALVYRIPRRRLNAYVRWLALDANSNGVSGYQGFTSACTLLLPTVAAVRSPADLTTRFAFAFSIDPERHTGILTELTPNLGSDLRPLRRCLLGVKCDFRISVMPLACRRNWIFAGCSGGGKSLVQAPSQQSVGQKVPVTFTVTIGTPSQTQSTKRNPQYIPTNTQSIVIDYIGDNPSATPAPTQPRPPTYDGGNGERNGDYDESAAGGRMLCERQHLHVHDFAQVAGWDLDLYVLAYSGQNGTGLLLSGAAVIVQVNANGTITQPGSTTPITIALTQKGAIVGTATLGAIGAIVPERYRKAERRCTELSNEFRAVRVFCGWNLLPLQIQQHTNSGRNTDSSRHDHG